jgi:hypothetical protein
MLMLRRMTALAALALSLGLTLPGWPAAALAPEPGAVSAASPSQTVTELAEWAVASGDPNGLPFVIVEKLSAQVFVFDRQGQPLGSTPALLGIALGDESTPGIGDRKLSDIAPGERTTPAGRFLAGFGPAAGHGETFWVDFSTALALHPVVTTNRREQRVKRLQSPASDDNRITYGCINVSADFYEQVVRRTFEGQRGVVYILPDSKRPDEVFPSLVR